MCYFASFFFRNYSSSINYFADSHKTRGARMKQEAHAILFIFETFLVIFALMETLYELTIKIYAHSGIS